MTGKVLEPHFVDLEKTTVRFKLVSETGVTSTAELKVPKDGARGVNPYWDQILDNFDVAKMRKDRNEQETRQRKQREAEDKKRKAHEENVRLRNLFNRKMKAFELPYINEMGNDVKAAIRRAPDDQFLTLLLNQLTLKYMTDNNMSYVDYLDYIDDLEDAKLKEKEKEKEQQTK